MISIVNSRNQFNNNYHLKYLNASDVIGESEIDYSSGVNFYIKYREIDEENSQEFITGWEKQIGYLTYPKNMCCRISMHTLILVKLM